MSVAMLINDYEVSKEELQKEWQMVKSKYLDQSLVSDKFEKMTLDYAKQSIISRVLIAGLVEELSEEVDYKDIKSEYTKMIEHFGGQEGFEDYFKKENTNEFEIKANIEKSIRVNRLMERWRQEGLSLMNEAEVIAYFEQNQEEYQVKSGVIATYFFITIKEENNQLEDISCFESSYQRLVDTGDYAAFFETVKPIKSLSHIEDLKIEKGYLPEEIEKKVFLLKEDEYSGIIKTPEGLHLFKKKEGYSAAATEFEEVADKVRSDLAKIKQDKYIKEKIIQLRKQATIKDFFTL